MKKLCIYHGNCADGFGAAWVVRRVFGEGCVDFHAGVYQQGPPDVTDKEVIMVDFSYKRPVLIEMAKKAKSILIIDHHKTAKDDLVDLPDNVTVDFDMDHSGAVLTWLHFLPECPPPKLLLHIEDRDLWRFKLEGTREIQANLFSYPYDFELWDDLMDSEPSGLISQGEAIERKHFKDINEFIKAAAYRDVIAGFDVPVLNAPYFWSSDAGHIMGEDELFAACYWDTPDGRVFSLRSSENGMDVSDIAKLFGGGGHKNASGFNLPFAKLDELSLSK